MKKQGNLEIVPKFLLMQGMGKGMKFEVTPELASLLKTVRVRNGVSSKDVAEHLGKSPSYLSKLEGGGVRSIDAAQLKDVFGFIFGGSDFYEVVMPELAALLLNTVAGNRLVDQVWFLQYDVIERPVEVPEGMAAEISHNFDAMHVAPKQVAAFINSNIDSEMTAAFPANEVIAMDYSGNRRLLIRADFPESAVEQVIRGKAPKTSYIILHTIVHAMFRMQRYPGVQTKLPPEDAVTLLNSAAEYMDRWNIHSLVGFSHYLASDEFIAGQMPLASTQSGIVERISAQLSEIVDHDSLNAISELNTFSKTLDWDPAFALKIIGLPFSKLNGMSFANKRKLVEELAELVDRYDAMDDFERKIESY